MLPADSPLRVAYVMGAMVYCVSIVFGRVYCGMHSITDVVGGSILAYFVYWLHWTYRAEFEGLMEGDSFWPGKFNTGRKIAI